jgi:hypothetical protein
MGTAAWLVSPYLSMLVICRSPAIARRVARHTAATLPLGWVAVLALFAAPAGLWSPPVAVLAVCAALSGLAVMTPGPGRGDDGRGPDDGGGGDDGPPVVDWDAFDAARRGWGGGPRQPAASRSSSKDR